MAKKSQNTVSKGKSSGTKNSKAKNETPAVKQEGSGSATAGIEEDPEAGQPEVLEDSSKGSVSAEDSVDAQQQVEQLRKEQDEDLANASASSHAEPVEALEGQANSQPPLVVVIPYKESAAKGDELRYALRAWDKFLPNVQIAIVGDLPDFLCANGQKPKANSTDVIHIPHTPTQNNPQVDVAQKLLAAIQSGLLPEYFIISNDDIYPLAPLTISDIDIHTVMGRLGKRGSAGSVYQKNAENTLKALKQSGIKKPWDYATHTPVGVWGDKLAEVISAFAADSVGYLVSTLYFNTQFPDSRPIIVDNGNNTGHPGTRSYVGSVFKKANTAAVQKAFDERKFMNNNDAGWSCVEPILKKLFPSPSRFEK
ncbi:MAG: hypothetical protein ABJG41_01395 [Cyclobacteriaceae bacterium]